MLITDFLLYAAIFDFIFGGYVLEKNPKSRQNISFGLLCFGIGLWVLGFYLLTATKTFYWPDKITDFGGIFTAGSLLFFTKVFPLDLIQASKPSRTKIFLEYLPLLILTALLPFNLFIKGANFTREIPTPINGPLVSLYALTLSAYVLFALKNFYRQFKASAGFKRQQISYVLLGLSVFLAVSLVFDLILPLFGRTGLRLAGPVMSTFFIFVATASIISYRLMDIRLFASALLSNLFGLTVSVSFILWTLHHLPDDKPELEILIPLGAIVLFLLGRYFLAKIGEKVFLKKYYDFERAITELNEKLRQDLKPKNLIAAVSIQLHKALGLNWISYYDLKAKKIFVIPHEATGAAAKYLDSSSFHEFAGQLAGPYFFNRAAEDFEIDRDKLLTGILPVLLNGATTGYFVFGKQSSWNGLSYIQIEKIRSAWQHIQTAYARAALRQDLENQVQSQVENIIEKNRRLRQEIQNRLEFVQATSHQLRTPVTALSGALQLLAKEPEESRKKELISIAYEKSKQLAGVISGILSLAKVEQGNIRSSQESLDLNKVFVNILMVVSPLADAKNLKIDYEIQNDLKIIGSQQYLEQVFANILENAIEFTASGGVKISFIHEPEHIIVCVKDNGPGIPEAMRSKVFNKNMHSPNSRGVGLGLYLVKTIINAHPKGHVWFESSDAGTTFFVRLKRAKQADVLK